MVSSTDMFVNKESTSYETYSSSGQRGVRFFIIYPNV